MVAVIKKGLCQCGCGRRAPLAPFSNKKRGWVKGQPLCFVKGHIGGINATKAYLAKFSVDKDGFPTKFCTWCEKQRPVDGFDRSSHNPNRLNSHCCSCQNEQAKANYKKNPGPVRERAHRARKKARIEIRARIARIKAMGCRACEEKDPCCIEFHHVFSKDYNTSQCTSIPEFERELIKCAPLCANCHKKAHAKRIVVTSKMICEAHDGREDKVAA